MTPCAPPPDPSDPPPPGGPPPGPARDPDPLQDLERETDVEFFVAGGPGGQHRNKTATGVRLRHRPTGIVVTATERRSQARNRQVAFERLAERLAARRRKRRPRIPTKVPAGAKRRRLEDKRRTSERKATRRKVDPKE